MAKKETAPKAVKPKVTKTVQSEQSEASVGPVAGEITTQPEPVKVKKTKVEDQGVGVPDVSTVLNQQFAAIAETLQRTCATDKQPRTLRWALKSLEAARDAAQTHAKHKV